MKSPVQARPVTRGGFSAVTQEMTQSGCDWFKCAAVAVSCAGVCIGSLGSAACISCLGSAYDSCKDCF